VLTRKASSARAVLRALAGPLDEPAQGQGCLGRVAEPFGDHRCPQCQYRGAVDADRLGWVHRRAAYASAKRKPTECPAARSAPQCSLSFSTLYPSYMGDAGEQQPRRVAYFFACLSAALLAAFRYPLSVCL
jgi:hypothetical protein